MHVVIRPEAEADLTRAFRWYELQRIGLGQAFITEVDRCLQAILNRPSSFPSYRSVARRALVSRFPYALYFAERDSHVVVFAAFHMARNPAILSARLRE